MNIPRIVIAGTHSGVGKTTISVGIMAALTEQGLKTQGFKVGPDYIDPGYHLLATGQPSRNLDSWMLGKDKVKQSFQSAGRHADICVIEGVMGLFDGNRKNGTGSTAEIAQLLAAPIVLVIDVRSMGQSAAALVKGYQTFWPQLKFAGVILNRIGSEGHRELVTEAIEHHCEIPVLGALSKNDTISTPERHLGLLPAAENRRANENIASLGNMISNSIKISTLLEQAKAAPPFHVMHSNKKSNKSKVTIAVARDEAFNFYYQDGLDVLRQQGAKLVYFSPLHDNSLPPQTDGIIIGGGFPESYLKELSDNTDMLRSLRKAHHSGMPIYAECGGYMYLTDSITGLDELTYSMVGLITGTSTMHRRLVGMGYIEAAALADNLLCSKGELLKGHEFHYSKSHPQQPANAFKFYGGRDADGRVDGYAADNLLASYLHLNFLGHETQAANFLKRCLEYKNGRV